MGRVNYGRLVGERKGILGGVLHERQELHGWNMTALELPQLPSPEIVKKAGAASNVSATDAAFHALVFTSERSADGFLEMTGWGKGYVWVNGFCLGRFWDQGPRISLYVPAPVVRAGVNEILIFELDGAPGACLWIRSEPNLG